MHTTYSVERGAQDVTHWRATYTMAHTYSLCSSQLISTACVHGAAALGPSALPALRALLGYSAYSKCSKRGAAQRPVRRRCSFQDDGHGDHRNKVR